MAGGRAWRSSRSASLPLASRNGTLLVVPAPLDEDELADRLAGADSAVVIKVGRHLDKVRRVLSRLGRDASAIYVERATLPGGRVLPLSDVEGGPAPYFSLILVPLETRR